MNFIKPIQIVYARYSHHTSGRHDLRSALQKPTVIEDPYLPCLGPFRPLRSRNARHFPPDVVERTAVKPEACPWLRACPVPLGPLQGLLERPCLWPELEGRAGEEKPGRGLGRWGQPARASPRIPARHDPPVSGRDESRCPLRRCSWQSGQACGPGRQPPGGSRPGSQLPEHAALALAGLQATEGPPGLALAALRRGQGREGCRLPERRSVHLQTHCPRTTKDSAVTLKSPMVL